MSAVEAFVLPMLKGDVPAVAGIASACFSVPWGADEFAAELGRDYAILRVLRPERGAPICAFFHFWRIADEAQIMNVACLAPYRGRGFGKALLRDGMTKARREGCRFATLEVRRSNAAAIGLYAAYGFSTIGVRQRYYSDNQEDALVMRCELDGPGTRLAQPGAGPPRDDAGVGR